MARTSAKAKKDPMICLCHGVKQSAIENAIRSGCSTASQIADQTSAGIGPCGGSCQPILKRMIQFYQRSGGEFPDNPKEPLPLHLENGS